MPEPVIGGVFVASWVAHLYRTNSFDGKTEQSRNIDKYHVRVRSWSSFSFDPEERSGPEPRSVRCLFPADVYHRLSLIAMFGERGLSSLEVEGAGKMLCGI